MSLSRFVLPLFIVASGAVACGGEVLVQDSDDGQGGNGGSGASGGTGGSGAAGGSGGTGNVGNIPNECLPYADEPGADPVVVTFTNESGLPIYLPSSCELDLNILPALGMDPANYSYQKGCLFTCEDLWTMEDVPACAPCQDGAYRLDPGAELEVVWDGTGLLSEEMPSQCFADPIWAPGCNQIVTANQGDYYIDVVGYSDCPNCDCSPDGYCTGQVGGIQAFPDSTGFSLPADDEVNVNFGVCAIPCPG